MTTTTNVSLTLVALHGNGGGGFRFARLQPHLPPHITFKAPTLPGFAATPPDPALQTLADYAEVVRRQLSAERRPLVLLGHGIGGSIALELAQRGAESGLDGLILHAPVGAKLEKRFFPKLMALPGARALGQRLFAGRLARPFFKRLLFSQPVPAAYLNRFFEEYRRCAVFGQMFELITPAWFNNLQPVSLPAALLWGERERVLGVDQLKDYQRLLPNHISRTIPTWDHFPMIEQPADYTREIIALAEKLVADEQKN